jgi:succinyl-diaminopimelate desuccinylase
MESFIEATKQFIRIPSTANNPAALSDALGFIIDQLSRHPQITVERFVSNGKPSLLAYAGNVRPKKFRVLLNAHIDVVPGKEEQFLPVIKEGRLYGRGAVDMKVAALVQTQVFCDLVTKVPYSLGLQIVTDEEVGGENGTRYQLSEGVDAQLVIAGEATPLGAICNESRGFCWVEVDFTGIAAHSAYPWNGTNAILLAQNFTQKLLAAIPTPASEDWCTTANIATISTPNTTFNAVPDQAKLGIDIRFVPGDKRFASHQTVVDFLQTLTPSGSDIRIKQLEPSHFADPQNDDLQALARTVSATTTEQAHFIRKHGAADTRFFSQKDIPAVTLGLQGAGLHSDNEYVEIDSIDRYNTILTKFLQTLR